MIERSEFIQTWESLCKRFGRDVDGDEAKLYRTYLEGVGMETNEFLNAAGALWATREFFPRPADFLLVGAEATWVAVQEALRHAAPGTSWHMDENERQPRTKLKEAGARALAVVESLGGLYPFAEEWTKSPLRARRAFLDAYELRILEESSRVPLPASTTVPRLAP